MKLLLKAVQRFTKRFSQKDNSMSYEIPDRPLNEKYIKRYSKAELAQLYKRPVITLMRWIHNDEDLMQELMKEGYKKSQKALKKEQIRIIFKHLGEPDYPQ